MKIKLAKRLGQLPPYLFAQIDRTKKKALSEGKDVIDFGVGDPDIATPAPVIEALCHSAKDPGNHRYPTTRGLELFRQAVADWYHARFAVSLDPATEIHSLIGSKEGIAHIPFAFLNPGDFALVPDPCYPPYKGGTIFSGAKPYLLPLKEENGFLPDFDKVPRSIARKAKLMFLNYPNNPTGAVATLEFLEKAVYFAKKNQIILCYDNAYSEISFEGCRAPSILQLKGAREMSVEFHSVSKTYNMTGWRLGWVCGNARIVEGLARVKSNIDSGVFQSVQLAGIAALRLPSEVLQKANRISQERRDLLCAGLQKLGWRVRPPKASFYVWAPLPKEGKKKRSALFAKGLLENYNLLVTPGIGFGSSGEGYVRFALTVPVERIQEALSRLQQKGVAGRRFPVAKVEAD